MYHNEEQDFKKMLVDRKNEEMEWRLKNIANMSNEELNNFLIRCDEPLEKDMQNFIYSGLDKDELEAIDGYNNVIKSLPKTTLTQEERGDIEQVFAFIIDEEHKHSKWLKMLQEGKAKEVLKEQKEE